MAAVEYDRMLALKDFNFTQFGYEPQEIQKTVHESDASILLVSGGEGSGKSVVTSAETGGRYGTWSRVLFVCYQAESATNEGDYLNAHLTKIGAVLNYSKPKGGNITLETRDGGIVESVTTHSKGAQAVSGTGKTYDIICMLEAGKQRYEVFLACLLRISRSGGLLILSGTIEESELWFSSLITELQAPAVAAEMNAQVIIMPTWENKLLYPGGRDDPKIQLLEKKLGAELFMERCGGTPSVPAALIFKRFSFLRHVQEWCKFDPAYPVQLAIDPGYSGSHYSVNAIQEHTRAYTRAHADEKALRFLPDVPLMDVWVIGDVYLHHAVHEEVIALCEQEIWWSRVAGGVGDIVMKTHPMADRAPIDVWLAKGRIFLRGQPVGIQDGIDRHNTFLLDQRTQSPRIFYNPSCTGALSEYPVWKRVEIGEISGGEKIYGKPEEGNCDALKAVDYYLIDRFGRVERGEKPADKEAIGSIRPAMTQLLEQLPLAQGLAQPAPRHISKHPVVRGSAYVVIPRQTKSNNGRQ